MHWERAVNDILDDFLRKSPRPLLDAALYWNGDTLKLTRGTRPSDSPLVFEIGSVGKTFTSTLLALLVRDGLVGLDDRVGHYCPDYPFGHSVTLRDLASHTAGLPRNPTGRWAMLTRGRQFAEAFTAADLDRFLRGLPGRRQTARYRYSNVGMALLGRILGARLGMTYEEAVIERLCRPLGMGDTRTDWRGYSTQRLVPGHDPRGRPVPPFVWAGMEAAGVWRSTVGDMMKFLGAQLGLAGPAWAALARSAVQPVARVSSDTRVGLGWMRSDVEGIGPMAWHAGGTFGQESVVGWALGGQMAMVILTNRIPSLWQYYLQVDRRLKNLPARIVSALSGLRDSGQRGQSGQQSGHVPSK